VSAATPHGKEHLAVLDGWRGISILLVLAGHFLPLGPRPWQLNGTAAVAGMALFFTLSGFLITRFLLQRDDVVDFLTRRLCRIVPLAWIAMAVALPMADAPASAYLPHFLFYANVNPEHLTSVAGHLWSLCVEMQFYVGVALLVWMFGRRGLYLLPVLCVAFTLHRVAAGAHVDIVTWRRVDEILAGAVLALAYANKFGEGSARFVSRLSPYLLVVLLAISSHPASGFVNYFRPYIAALLVGATLFAVAPGLDALLKTRVLAYVAAISYALYVIHQILDHTWLGSGDKLARYVKRPLLFLATFALAHVSTFHFEKHWIAFGKRLSERRQRARTAAADATDAK